VLGLWDQKELVACHKEEAEGTYQDEVDGHSDGVVDSVGEELQGTHVVDHEEEASAFHQGDVKRGNASLLQLRVPSAWYTHALLLA